MNPPRGATHVDASGTYWARRVVYYSENLPGNVMDWYSWDSRRGWECWTREAHARFTDRLKPISVE